MTTINEIRTAIRQAAHECTETATGTNDESKAFVLARTATTLHTCADRMLQAAMADSVNVDNDLSLELLLSRAVEEDRRGDAVEALDVVLEAASYLRSKINEAQEVAS